MNMTNYKQLGIQTSNDLHTDKFRKGLHGLHGLHLERAERARRRSSVFTRSEPGVRVGGTVPEGHVTTDM